MVDIVEDNLVYQQLSQQIGLMSKSVLQHRLVQKKMCFNIDDIEGNDRDIKIVKMKDDGSCLFRSVSHQLFPNMKVNSVDFENKVKELRAEAVEYIKQNVENFERQLANAIYDRQIDQDAEVSVIEVKCRDFLYNELPKSNCWAGSESLIALSHLYEVNIFVFNEDGSFYCVSGFTNNYAKSICVAFRLSNRSSGKSKKCSTRNHYRKSQHCHKCRLEKGLLQRRGGRND